MPERKQREEHSKKERKGHQGIHGVRRQENWRSEEGREEAKSERRENSIIMK